MAFIFCRAWKKWAIKSANTEELDEKKWNDEEIWILKNFSFCSVKIVDRDERKIEEFNIKNHEW